MRQFYEAYASDPIVSPLVTQLPWSHHLIILGQSKRTEERDFYIRLSIRERWSKRELERQFKAALFERAVLTPPKVPPLVAQRYPEALHIFKDAYAIEFLGLPNEHPEEALDRNVRKPHEQPSIGVPLCATKNDEVVEFALSRSLSSSVIAEHKTQLPDKGIVAGEAPRVLPPECTRRSGTQHGRLDKEVHRWLRHANC